MRLQLYVTELNPPCAFNDGGSVEVSVPFLSYIVVVESANQVIHLDIGRKEILCFEQRKFGVERSAFVSHEELDVWLVYMLFKGLKFAQFIESLLEFIGLES